jgi:hypothetical protein
LDIALGRLTQAIGVHEHRAVHVQRLALALALGNASSRKLNERQRVAATRSKQVYVQVYVAASILKQATDPSAIAALALAFAAQIDAATLGYDLATSSHHPR